MVAVPTAPAKAELRTENNEVIPLLFNPAELTITKAASWNAAESKGNNSPLLKFSAGQPGTIALSITLDTTDKGTSVTDYTDKLMKLVSVDPKLPDSDKSRNKARPPWVTFHWGPLHSFKAVVERLTLKFTYFAANGMPLRAKADLALKQYEDEAVKPLQNPTSHTPSLQTVHRLTYGETLDRLAAKHYADSTRWRLIAEANNVMDPLGIEPGTLLIIPELPVRRRG
ncbi:CIS tube protein [Paractinoplanes globisporus]|jgi:nucleoid-associated protein YgaU|uniref:LysM peptidoglycan-binding domain-containing protein n=1 Tax=Paractinoplanes globisporus TaxID=113565 RepID=A0ABW6W4K4_9ACTN|nr:LysM peptidoglycan-binding domain-containing protein [Actinoplanes globisporus]